MDEPTCGTCIHFRQHYILFYLNRYDPIPCGHCVCPRLKHRKPSTLACVHYQQKPMEQQ